MVYLGKRMYGHGLCEEEYTQQQCYVHLGISGTPALAVRVVCTGVSTFYLAQVQKRSIVRDKKVVKKNCAYQFLLFLKINSPAGERRK